MSSSNCCFLTCVQVLSRGRSGGLVFPSLSEFSTVYYDPHSQRLWHRIWYSSAGIPSPPLALFIVVLRKAHLTLHSRMLGSRWVITISWLSGSLRSFLYSSSILVLARWQGVFLPPLLTILLLLDPYHFCLLSLHEVFSLVSLIFLKRSLVFPILLFSSISLHWSLRKSFLSLPDNLWKSAFRWVYLSFSPFPFTSIF